MKNFSGAITSCILYAFGKITFALGSITLSEWALIAAILSGGTNTLYITYKWCKELGKDFNLNIYFFKSKIKKTK